MPKNNPLVFAIDWNACIRCGACIAVCPLEESFTSPFDTIAVGESCDIACLACEEICPVSAISHQPSETMQKPGGILNHREH